MSEGFLPPIIAYLQGDASGLKATIDESKADLATLDAEADASLSGVGAAGSAAAEGGLRDVETAAEDAGVALSSGLGSKADKAADDVDKAGRDMERSSERTGGVFHKLGDVLENTGLPFSGAAHKIGDSLEGVEKTGSGAFSGLAHAGKLAAIGLLAGFAGVAAGSLEELADKFEPVQAALQTAVDNTGQSFSKMQPQIAALQSRFAGLGFNMTDTDSGLQTLVTSTGSVRSGMKEMGLAANIARLNNISLSAAANMVAKANAGSARIMTQWGINANIVSGKAHAVQTASQGLATAQLNLKNVMKEVADGAIPATEAQEQLASAHNTVRLAVIKHQEAESAIGKILSTVSGRVKDAAYNYGKTLSGQLHIAGAEVENLGTKFGLKLIPVLLDAIKVAGRLFDWLGQNKPVLYTLAGLIGTTMVVAIGAWVASLFGAEGALAALGTSAGAASISVGGLDIAMGPLIVVIAAVAVAAYELYKHWRGVWTGIKDVTHLVVEGIVDAFNWIVNTGKDVIAWVDRFVHSWGVLLIPMVGPMLFVATHWREIWDDVKSVAVDAWHWIDSELVQPIVNFFSSTIPHAFDTGIKFFERLPGQIKNVFTGAITWLWQAGHDLLQGLWNGIESMFQPVVNLVSGLGSDVSKAWGWITGSHSPSTVFHQHGVWLMQGLAEGIAEGYGAFVSPAMSKIAGQVNAAGGLNSRIAVGTIGAAAGPGVAQASQASSLAGMGGEVHIHVELDGRELVEILAPGVRAWMLQKARSTGSVFGPYGGIPDTGRVAS